MSDPISLFVSESPPGIDDTPQRLVLQIATNKQGNGRFNHDDPIWRTIPEVIVDNIEDRSGPEPSTCDITVPRSMARRFTEQGPDHIPPVPEGPATEDSAEDGFFVAEFLRFDLVRVVIQDKSVQGNNEGTWNGNILNVNPTGTVEEIATVIFIGNVMAWDWGIDGETVVVHLEDFRWRLRRMHFYGTMYGYNGPDVGLFKRQGIVESLPIFNQGGLPNRFISANGPGDITEKLFFGPLNLHPENQKLFEAGSPLIANDVSNPRLLGQFSFCEFWSIGHALAHLRLRFSQVGLDDFTELSSIGLPTYDGVDSGGGVFPDKFLDWPEVAEGSFPGLFAAVEPSDNPASPGPTKAQQYKEMNIAGAHLADAIAILLNRSAQGHPQFFGNYDWILRPVQGNAAVARLEIFNTADPAVSFDLALPEPGESVAAMPKRDLFGGSMTIENSGYRNRIFALGGKRIIQTSFDTIAGTLVPNWSDAEQASYEAARTLALNDLIPDANDKDHPAAFLQWAIKGNLDWANDVFDGGDRTFEAGINDGIFLQEQLRKLQARLVRLREDSPGVEFSPIRVNVLLFRSIDFGDTWELAPIGLPIKLEPDAAIIRIGPDARRPIQNPFTDDGKPWAYQLLEGVPDIPFDFLLTVAVEADDHLFVADAAPAGEYPAEIIHMADREFKYESVSRARGIPYGAVTGPGLPVVEGKASPDIEIDDTTKLEALVRRRKAQLQHAPVTATIRLSGYDSRFPVGTGVGAIKTSFFDAPGKTSTRGPYFLRAVVREAVYTFGDEWETNLMLESLPR